MSTSIGGNPTAQTVAALLPKLHDADPDYRFMSLNDLFQVLSIGRPELLHNDYNTAARTVDGVLKTLDDQNGEVQNLAIKCLAPLVTKLPSTIIPPLMEKLSNMSTENSVDNSIPVMALRTVVITLPRPLTAVMPTKDVVESYSAISRVLIPRLVGRVVLSSSKHSNTTKLPIPPPGMLQLESEKTLEPEAVDVLIEVVRCFGPMLQQPEVEALKALLIGILETDRARSVVKKRAVVAMSILANYLTDDDLSNFVSQLIESLRNPHLTPTKRRLYFTVLGSMARSIPSRFGPYLKTLAPFVLTALSEEELSDQLESSADDNEPDPEINDVREAALVALEGFLASCGAEMRSFTAETIAAALRFLKYDPNYNFDEDEEMDGTDDEGMDDFDDDDEFEADGGFGDDDDDFSWKVRRCAAKALYTLISTRGSGDLLEDGTLYSQVAPVLVQRFSEREENVRLEIIATMAILIRKTGEGVLYDSSTAAVPDYTNQAPQSRKRRRESSTTTTSFDSNTLQFVSTELTSPISESAPVSGPRNDLSRLSPLIIKASAASLKTGPIATKQAIIRMLDDVVSVQNGGLSQTLSQIVDLIVDAIKSSSHTGSSSTVSGGAAASATLNTLRIAALKLIGNIIKTHPSSVLESYLPKVVPGVISTVDAKYYKISSEAIGTIEQLVKALTPPRSKSLTQDHKSDLHKIYQVIVGRVSATEADLEVRQRAIHALGILLARSARAEGSSLFSPANRTAALDLLYDRLKNETTRLAAVHAVDTVAAVTRSHDQLQPKWVRDVSLELAAQLRKANRFLRGASLAALKSLVISPASRSSLDTETIRGLTNSLLPLLTSSDLHLLGPAIVIIATLVTDDAKLVVTPQLDNALCDLLTAQLGGSVLEAILDLVKIIGEKRVGQPLMHGLLNKVGINGDPAVVGKVIGTLLVYGGASVGVTLESFHSELSKSSSDGARQSLALAVLGEAGFRLGSQFPLPPSTFTDQFNSTSDKVPLAAAVALGRAGAGNVAVYLPEILSAMDNSQNNQYLLLHSVKEVLQQVGNYSADISTYTRKLWEKLFAASLIDDNKVTGAECIGRLAIIEPKEYLPRLQFFLRDSQPPVRAMVIQAIRYTLPDSDESFDSVLKTMLVDMLVVMLSDPELENCRLALTTLNSATHNKPDLIIPNLGQVLPLVMNESVIKPELVREVMMGPFKHKVDDGLEVRKGAYETLYSFMETAFSRINILEFYDRVIAGLKDDHDIRAICNLMLTKLVQLDPDETARRLDAIADCFRTILSTKLKENAVKQELEKQDEACKSVLRASQLLHNSIPAASNVIGAQAGAHQTWRTYWEWIEKDFESQLRLLEGESKDIMS